jgi:hypothetical protein
MSHDVDAFDENAVTTEDLTVGETFNGGLATLVAYNLGGDPGHLGTTFGLLEEDAHANYVVWTVNLQTGGYSGGDYHTDLQDAIDSYRSKRERNNR